MASASNPPAPRRLDTYPLQGWFLALGVVLGFSAALWFSSPLIGFSLFVLVFTFGTLWHRDEPPILAFCIGWQWIFATVGFLLLEITGIFPGRPDIIPGGMDQAVLVSLSGFMVLLAGIRLGLSLVRETSETTRLEQQNSKSMYDVKRLFWWVIAVFTFNWFTEVLPIAIFFNAAQVIDKLLVFRLVLLVLLFFAIAQQRRGYLYGVLALAFVTVPTFASSSAAFTELMLLPIIVLITQWRPWARSSLDRKRDFRAMFVVAVLAAAVAIATVFWIGAVKGPWRNEIYSGQAGGSVIERVQKFSDLASAEVQKRDLGYVTNYATARVSSGAAFFADVLNRVPAIVPHEGGQLTKRAITHIVRPRLLFPEKDSIRASSWLVREYAGRAAAGSDSKETGHSPNTSIGLTYMAEFYIDFGIPWMFFPILLYGLTVGLMYRALRRLSPSHDIFASAAVVLLLSSFISYEGEFALTMGGMMMNFLVFSAILYFAGSWLHRKLTMARESNQ